MDGEDAGVAADVAELPVGVTGEDAAAIAAEELDRPRRRGGGVGGLGDGRGGDVVEGAERGARRGGRRRGPHHGFETLAAVVRRRRRRRVAV